jgi:lauroyl/myristoyl acyltransferase
MAFKAHILYSGVLEWHLGRYRFKHLIEYGIIRMVALLLGPTPYRFALLIGWGMALFGHYVLRYRVDAAKARIREVFGGQLSQKQVNRIAWRSWRDFIFNAVEIFRLPRIDQHWISKHVLGYEAAVQVIKKQCDSGQGAIIASPHMGAAEMASVVYQRSGIPIFMLTGKQKNPLADAYINKLRGATGIPKVQKGSALLKGVLGNLRKGGVLAFLADLRVSSNGIMVDFLGKKASVAPGMGVFAKQTNVPIFPVIAIREGWAKHRLQVYEAVRPDPALAKKPDQERLTQAVFVVMEEAVRRYPEQWFWYNKNWILTPPDNV